MPADNDSVLAEFAAKLRGLIEEGARALEREDQAAIRLVQQKLNRFPDDSPSAADALDRTALLAAIDLDAASTRDAAARIRSRSDEVARLAKLIDAAAERAAGSADTLRLNSVRTALTSATDAISAFKTLREQLKSDRPDESTIKTEITQIIDSIQLLRNRIEKV